jgi:cell shape-determining protein MreC
MNYVLKSSVRGNGRVPRPIKIAAAVVLLLVFLQYLAPRALPAFFTTLVRPLWTAERGLLHGETPREELEKMMLEIQKSSVYNNALLEENNELKAILGRTDKSTMLLASILKRPPYSAYDTFILDVGSDRGVHVGDQVFSGSVPIGTIAEVFGTTSKVRLYTSAGEKFDILIGPTHIQTVAVGKGGGFFETSLPRDTKMKVGDTVRIPTLGDSFVGTVQGIASDPSEPFTKILFRQPVSIYEMRWVLIKQSP